VIGGRSLQRGVGSTGACNTDAEWLVSDMRRLALERRFDGVLAWDSLFHLRSGL
jgi:hypothetical protein